MRTLSDPERRVVETIGELIEFWGFSKHHGRIWALLYLSEDPFHSREIQATLGMSAGLVSMSLKELLHWDVVEKVWVPNDRKDHYTANTDLWHMISRVVREREYRVIEQGLKSLDDALGDIETTSYDDPLLPKEKQEFIKPRVQHLVDITETFTRFLDLVLTRTEASLAELQTKMKQPPDTT